MCTQPQLQHIITMAQPRCTWAHAIRSCSKRSVLGSRSSEKGRNHSKRPWIKENTFWPLACSEACRLRQQLALNAGPAAGAHAEGTQPTQPGNHNQQGYTHTEPQSSASKIGLKSAIQCNYYCYCNLACHLATPQSIQQRGEQCSLIPNTLQSLWKHWYEVSSFLMHLKSYFLPVTKETISNEALQSVAVWRKPEPLREQVCVNSYYLLKATLPCTQKWI